VNGITGPDPHAANLCKGVNSVHGREEALVIVGLSHLVALLLGSQCSCCAELGCCLLVQHRVAQGLLQLLLPPLAQLLCNQDKPFKVKVKQKLYYC